MSLILKNRAILLAVMVVGFTLTALSPLQAQTYLETFGQNRLQTRKFDWRFFDTRHFRVYHYDAAGRQLARYVAEQAEKDINVIEDKMGGKFPHRFNIILYNDYDEYRQTNIGRKYDGQLQDIPAGTVDLVGDRLVVYYTGIHTDLRRQLRSGMSRVVMERMLFGENFREMVRNAVSMNMPPWITDGFLAYLVDGWDAKSETDWKNMLQAFPKASFYELAERQPELAGKAFWKYISERYGENNVKNLLYAMQLKSNMNQGIKLTLNQTAKKTFDSTIAFYNNVYAQDALHQDTPDTSQAILKLPVPKDNTIYKSIKVSPRGFDVAYVGWKEGEYKVYIHHTGTPQERSVVLDGGMKDHNEVPDPDYPILAWNNTGFKLAILYKRGSQTRLRIYNSVKAKIENYVIPPNRFDRVLGMTFMEEDDKLVFSAIKKSQTDLFQFTIRGSRITNITNDAWNDVQPWFISGGSKRGLLFLSNRPEANLNVPIAVNQLPTGPMNMYFYDTKTKRPELLKCSNITTGTINQPIQYGNENFAFLYDTSGVNNKYVVLFGRNQNNEDSAYAVPVTNYTQSLISHQYNPASNQVADVIQVGNQYNIFFKPFKMPDAEADHKVLIPTTLSHTNKEGVSLSSEHVQHAIERDAKSSFVKTGDVFQSEFTDTDTTGEAIVFPAGHAKEAEADAGDIDSIMVDSTYVKLKAMPYRLSFKPDFFSVKVDNSVLFTRYQPVAFTSGQFTTPPLGGMITISLNDAMENHRFTGGFKLPINFSGSTYFLQYENFERRIDWSLLFLRTTDYLQYQVSDGSGAVLPPPYDVQLGKLTTNLLQGSVTYPFDRVRSAKLHLGLRQDVRDFKAKDTVSLSFMPREKIYWILSRGEYVYDNSISPALNIRLGLRFKLYAEYLYKLSKPNGGFFNIGTDVRYYTRIYRNIIAAGRFAYAHSAGNQKVLYQVGSVDNAYLPIPAAAQTPPPPENFAFVALATNMRGYKQNAKSGNTYGLINAEIRAPIMSSLMRKPIQSSILKNLQAIAFMDLGSAWSGWLPNEENIKQPYSFPGPPVSIKINDPSQGVLLGYGAGLRTMLFGYFMRVDAAWNIEGRKKPIWYFSVGTDF